jgi:hypothetical protein
VRPASPASAVSGSTNGSQLDTASATPPVSYDWVGTVDELRTFNSTLSDAKRDQYLNNPTHPLQDTDRQTRYMFDEGSGSSTFAHWANQTVGLTAFEWVDGINDPGFSEGSDYELNSDGPEVTVLSGGNLEGAPVVYVLSDAGRFGGLLTQFGNIGQGVFSLLMIAVLGIAVARITGVLEEF